MASTTASTQATIQEQPVSTTHCQIGAVTAVALAVARLQARPVVHAREDPRVLDSDHPDVCRHRGDHPLDLPAGGLRVVPVVLSSSCLSPCRTPLPPYV